MKSDAITQQDINDVKLSLSKKLFYYRKANSCISLFYHWLRKNNYLHEFIHNYVNSNEKYPIISISNLIVCSFNWDTTQEGMRFWLDKDLKWKAYCFKNHSLIDYYK